jgi:hypothetical protein
MGFDYTGLEIDKEELAIVREVQKRSEQIDSLDIDDLTSNFPEQREFINDPNRLKAACCSRRSGKSHGVAIMLLKHAIMRPGCTPVYINMNRGSAQLIIWPALRDLSNKYNLGLQFIKASGDIIVPNGSEIRVFGAGSMREMDKVRGVGTTLTIACLDEAQNFGADMEYLVRNVILPATADHKAPIVITGTPNQVCAGPFHEICHQSGEMVDALAAEGFGWSVHSWTMHENPHISDVEEEYKLAKAANGWNDNTPAYRREYFGEWVRDTAGLCFDVVDHMFVDKFPEEDTDDWVYQVGVDIGTKDPCAFTVLAFSEKLAITYVLQSYRDHVNTIEAGNEIDRLMQVFPIEVAVIDAGGMGARDLELWETTHPHLPTVKAKKGPGSVDMGISLINADIRAGKVKFIKPNCKMLIDEMQLLSWDDDLRGLGRRKVKAGDDDHCADSFRYGYQRVRTHTTDGFEYQDYVDPASTEGLVRTAKELRAKALTPPSLAETPRWLGLESPYLS